MTDLISPSPSEVMTAREVAVLLRVSQATVYRLAKKRGIPSMRVGRAWRFPRQKVEEWMQLPGTRAGALNEFGHPPPV